MGEALSLALSLHEIRPLVALTPDEGLATLAARAVDVVIQDMNFTADTTSGEEGVALFRAIREQHPDLPVILLTAWTHLETAVELVKAGAADYLAKPWDDSKLLATVENLLELSESTREMSRSRTRAPAAPRERCSASTTWAAWCSPPRRWRARWSWPARSRARTCRC